MLKTELYELYVHQKMKTREIASKFGCDKSTILYWLKKHNIPTNPSGRHSIDISGQSFNNLTVKNKVGNKWLCKCVCGNELEVSYSSLKKGQKGCWSCRNKEISKANYKGYEEISGDRYGAIARSAKDRNLEFNLSIEYLWSLYLKQNKKCNLSGVDISFTNNDNLASLDRINSSLGYIEGNVQWVHKTVNYMKMDINQDSFIYFCRKINDTQTAL